MLINYLKIAFRNMLKNKTQSLIGIFGLAFGIVCFVPAYYWLSYETGYDSFYPDARHIYRIYTVEKQSGKVNERVPGILETKLHEQFPATEISTGFVVWYESYRAEEVPHIQLRTLYTDSAFFRVFPQVIVSGDARQPLQTERNIILTESSAIRLFGDVEKAIGQPVSSTLYSLPPYMVSAVVKDPPPNTNLSFDAIHFPEMQNQMTANMPEESQWKYFDKQMYVKLNPYTNVETLAGELRDFTSRLGVNPNIDLHLLPIGDVRHRLDTNLPFTLGFIRMFIAAGLLLLFSAFFNFLNLGLGLFRQRIHEFRQRMVTGAKSGQIIIQMMFELTCTILLSLAFALCLVVLVSPALSGLLDISVNMPQFIYQVLLCGVSVIILTLLVGIFPLWRFSRSVLHDLTKRKSMRQPALRHVAVALQLAVSVVFIVAALVVMMQLSFVNNRDLGFDRHGIIQLSLSDLGYIPENKRTALMHELSAIPQILNITATGFEPRHATFETTEVEWPGKSPYDKPAFQSIGADNRFAETFRFKMMQGAWWNEGEKQRVVLNEEAVRVMGLHDPVGSVIRMYPGFVRSDGNTPMYEYEVVGVVNDFHTLSLRSRIYPTIFRESAFDDNILYIRIVSGQEREVVRRINTFLPDIDVTWTDIRITPLDELYDRLNHSEQTGLKIFTVLAVVCLLISLIGIYAVATASTQRRRKEIAIRKVMGADFRDIIRMFFREHTLQVIMAGAVALPLAYLAMTYWLQGYAYHTNIPWWLLAGVIIALVAVVLLTVLGQVQKAANSNPADVLKSE